MLEIPAFEYMFVAEVFEYWALTLSIRLGGYQPHYFPRLHCIARMFDCDISPIADYVQYVRKHSFPSSNGMRVNGPSYQAQTPIKTQNGTLLLGVPVVHAGMRQPLNKAKIAYETSWSDTHVNIIEQQYRAAPQFATVFPELKTLLGRRYASLADLNIATTAWSLAFLLGLEQRENICMQDVEAILPQPGTRLKKVMAISTTSVRPPDKEKGRDANDWIIDMCRHFNANEYYFGGTSAACYLDFKRFEDAGIRLYQQSWICTPYTQRFPEHGFAPNLSIIDLLMNVPPKQALAILHTSDQDM